MGSQLGPVPAGIFMVELETRNWITPTLGNMVLNWKRFVDDTIGYVKNGNINIISSKLNRFHPNIVYLRSRRRKQTVIFGRPTNQKRKFY